MTDKVDNDYQECSTKVKFANRLLKLVSELHGSDLYSDLDLICEGHTLRAHRFVICSHTEIWGDLAESRTLTVEDDFDIISVLLEWMYTFVVPQHIGTNFMLRLLTTSIKYQTDDLTSTCVQRLVSELDTDNCVSIYQTAIRLDEKGLENAASSFIKQHWADLSEEHFSNLSADEVVTIVQKNAKFPLHTMAMFRRGDAVNHFLTYQENCKWLNKRDESQRTPLSISFDLDDLETAQLLCDSGADVNLSDNSGACYLAKAVKSGTNNVLEFLIRNNVDVNYKNVESSRTLLHDLAAAAVIKAEIQKWVESNIARFNVNAVDSQGRTPLAMAVESGNITVLDLLLTHKDVKVDTNDAVGQTPLQNALFKIEDLSVADKLLGHGADINVKDREGNSALHRAVKEFKWKVLSFLVRKGSDVNAKNNAGQTSLHLLLNLFNGKVKAEPVLVDILNMLLNSGADPSIVDDSTGQNAIHSAICLHAAVLSSILQRCAKESVFVIDSEGNSALWMALKNNRFESASLLISAGADVDEKMPDGTALLKAVQERRDDIVDFLIRQNANVDVRTQDGRTCLHLSVDYGMTSTVDALCKLGASMNLVDPVHGAVPLWVALENRDFATAQVLVAHGCDLDRWCVGDNEVEDTLLHKAIRRKDVKAAVFLIKNGCDVNATPKAGDSYGSVSLSPALHLSVQSDLLEVSEALISNLKCRVDAQDQDGNTAAHLAVLQRDQETLSLLLAHPDPTPFTIRNNKGQTPLEIAMELKCNTAADAICGRLPHAALQVNADGDTLLHVAVRSDDLEIVLFLLGLQVDVNIASSNNLRVFPIHISAQKGNELIMRNLMLAGADLNCRDAFGRTPLHLAAIADRAEHCKILVENGADPNATDNEGNSAMHVAVLEGAVNALQTLLNESNGDPLLPNKQQRNLAHLCASVPGLTAAELLQTLLETHPKYPLEVGDSAGNTAFLLAFINRNVDLCQLLLKYNVCLSVRNNSGSSVFHLESHSDILTALLINLDREPRWEESDTCSSCETRFSITMRKHHCRHCGRLVCAKCSETQMPILKYNLAKNVRICQVCYQVLTTGMSGQTQIDAK